MPTEILLPQWGMEMDEGTVVRWLKKEGDEIQEGEPLVEIETAKLTTELESFASGVVARIVVPEGETVPIRAVLAVIAAPGEVIPGEAVEAPARPMASPAAPATLGATGRPGAQVVPAARRLAKERGIDLSLVQGSGPNGRIVIADVERAIEVVKEGSEEPEGASAPRVQVVPAARRLARELGIDLAVVQGSGPNGRIVIADVERAVESEGQGSGDTVVGDYEEPGQFRAGPVSSSIPMEGIRQTIASRMLQSLQTMAQVTLTIEADVTQAMLLREGLSRHMEGGSLSPLHLAAKAAAKALQQHPRLNAIQTGDSIQLMEQVNIGLAVSLPEGLVTPVLRDVPEKGLGQIAREARELAGRARENRSTPQDVSGGSFTITNLGAYDIDAFTPIINPPQVAILGVGRAVEKPVIRDGEFAKATMMFLSLTFDHRVVDGAPAAEFLQTVKGCLEDPWWMVAQELA